MITSTLRRGLIALSIGCLSSMSSVAMESAAANDRVVFVCEHGSVKSVMAASLFNQTAQKRGAAVRAVSRGVTPDAQVPPRIVEALKVDGIDVATFKPQRVAEADTAGARRVVAIGLDPASLAARGPVETWNDVPESSNYPGAKAALQKHIEALLDELEAVPRKEGTR